VLLSLREIGVRRSPAFSAGEAELMSGEMVAMPMINAAAAQRAPESRSGSYLGAYSVAFSAGWVAGPSVGMAIYSGFGGTVLWLAAGAMAVPLGLGFAGLSRRFRAPRPVNG
jgi:MFS family permease